jgi:hypothetical protein
MRHLIGLTLVHDSLCFAGDTAAHLLPVRHIQDAFGWDATTEFLPYWRNVEYVQVLSPASENVVVSAYRRPGRLMLVPFNNTDATAQLRLRLNRTALSLSRTLTHLADAETREQFPLAADGTVQLPLEARAFRILQTPQDEIRGRH